MSCVVYILFIAYSQCRLLKVKVVFWQVADEEDEEDDFEGLDFTTPFFEKFGFPRNKQDEILMKKRIMLNAKVKLVKKAHSIRESYERVRF